MANPVYSFQECSIQITSAPTQYGWDDHYYARWGVTPDNASGSTWNLTGGGGTAVVTNGILQMDTMTTGSTATMGYVDASWLSSIPYNIEWKARALKHTGYKDIQSCVVLKDTLNTEIFEMFPDQFKLKYAGSTWNIDASKFHTYRIHVETAAHPSKLWIYIDNKLLASTVFAGATACMYLSFGDFDIATGNNSVMEFEFFRVISGADPYLGASATGLYALTDDHFVRQVTLTETPMASINSSKFALFERSRRILGMNRQITIAGDLNSFQFHRDLSINKDYRIAISGYNDDSGEYGGITCERCRISNKQWSLMDNAIIGENMVFDVFGMVF